MPPIDGIDPRADEERVAGRDLPVEQELLVLAEQVVLAEADAAALVRRLVVERGRDHPRVLVLREDVDRYTSLAFGPVHLDVLEQAARHEARFTTSTMSASTCRRPRAGDQLDGVRGRLLVVLDDDLPDLAPSAGTSADCSGLHSSGTERSPVASARVRVSAVRAGACRRRAPARRDRMRPGVVGRHRHGCGDGPAFPESAPVRIPQPGGQGDREHDGRTPEYRTASGVNNGT